MKRVQVALLLLVALGLSLGYALANEDAEKPSAPDLSTMTTPHYTEDGELLIPKGHREWVLAGSSVGLSYNPAVTERDGPGLIHNVYIQPEAYRHYAATGEFPEKTILVLELFRPQTGGEGSFVKGGHFSGDRVAIEVALKDSERFEEKWAYFNFARGGGKIVDKTKAMPKGVCYSCHLQHAADDNVFTQFYPTLRDVKPAEGDK